ncbi:hypothetical protein OTERR_20750 [Oryzomicrobium terrae]|uniref:Uncharacterized protein n=1 Tax=Oryzomicrobium terrae TaxID=1735038 RepID=A0A5C1E996_9RHOO|nr:hypothetical protein [Oryzomicrobium terrae]QEL65551.1 hypothetical protein OTERR_20750 [Oryzomicrobium terrae]
MKRIQKWFEQIAGITQEERERWALAQQVFATQPIDVLALQVPAYWRRKARVSGVQR